MRSHHVARLVGVAVALLALAGEAFAAAGGEATRELFSVKPYIDTVIWSLLTFLAVLGILGKFAWPHILKGLDDRERKIRESLEAAERAQAESRRLIEEHQSELEEARRQAREIIDEGKRDAERLAATIEAKAKEESEVLLERARLEIGREKEKALHEIQESAVQLSFEIAEKLVAKSLDRKEHEALVSECLESYAQVTES